MLDALGVLLPAEFIAVDLACGPGTISRRVLARFPRARCIAVDLDPVTLAMGQAVLGTADGRLRWVEADLNDPVWTTALSGEQVDAVLTSTALHWLPTESLIRLYRELGRLLRPGGLFFNADNFAFAPHLPSFAKLREWKRETLWSEESFAARGEESWARWWDALGREPGARELIAERERRFAWHQPGDTERPPQPIYEVHVAALRDAGFREVGSIWQRVDNHVLLAVR